MAVVDDGAGLPDGFELATTSGLGLSIVRTLVESELAGQIDATGGEGRPGRPGTVVSLAIPVQKRRDAP